jgi:hypothetical protein
MSEEFLAVSKVSPAPAAQADYDSICTALMHTERGRWFLEEYARRNRTADTKLLLAAIHRIEAVVGAERNKQPQPGFRTDLLEMAKAITRTRAEVAEIRSDASSPPPESAVSPRQPRDVFAAAERIRDVTWAMRGHGFDPSTCDQLEELAASILSASALRDPTDRRAAKLSEVLQYLEHRIDTLLEGCTDGDAAASEPAPEADHQAFTRAVTEAAVPVNGFAGAFVPAPGGLEAADFEAAPAASPSSQQSESHGAPPAAPVEVTDVESEAGGDLEGEEAAAQPPLPADEIVVQEAPLRAPPESTISKQDHELEAKPADDTQSAAGATDCVEPTPTSAERAPAEPVAAREGDAMELTASAELTVESHAVPEAAPALRPDRAAAQPQPPAATKPQDALSPTVKLVDSSRLLPNAPDLRAMSSLRGAARSFLPEIDMRSDMPGLDAAWARHARPAAAIPPVAAATTREPAGLARAQPPSPAIPSSPAAAGDAPASQVDPLAALKAMSEYELIALFS